MESAAVQSILTKIVDHTVMPEADRAALALAIVDLDPSTKPAESDPLASGQPVSLTGTAPVASPNDPNAPAIPAATVPASDTLDSRESRDSKRAALVAELDKLDAEDTADDTAEPSAPRPPVGL